ncbi:MAG TPA: amino acid adenylation domain-containing protein, partial [Acidobacteriota bacterium]|nr:amino acid adenylation domain-containing protein [Acidobacteriota bacterium]
MKDVAQDIASLSPEKRKLVEKLLRQQGVDPDSSALPIAARDDASAAAPCSFAQERVWFLDQLEPEGAHFNLLKPKRLRGELDLGILRQSLGRVVQRHDILRTVFRLEKDSPVQVVIPYRRFDLPCVDLSGLGKRQRRREMRRQADILLHQPMALARGPLFKALLLRLEEDDHVLLAVMHHLVFDGWSTSVFYRDLAHFYDFLSGKRPSPPPPLAIQYADFAVWQRRRMLRQNLGKQLDYWKERLSGEIPLLELPADRRRPSLQSFRGGRERLRLTRDLTAQLLSLSRREGVTLYMTLLAAFKLLLLRFTGVRDIVVGSPIANRNRAEIEPLIGFFVNTLALRTDLSGNPSFLDLLDRVRETALEAYAHQDLPFEKLVEELGPRRDMSHQPFFQILFHLQNAPEEDRRLGGLRMSDLRLIAAGVMFDLEVTLWERDGRIEGVLEYAAELFDQSTIQRFCQIYLRLLQEICVRPERCLQDFPLLDPEERAVLLGEGSAGHLRPVPDRLIHTLFEERAASQPDQVALRFGDERMSFGQLNERSNQIAHGLERMQLDGKSPIALLLEREPDQVVSLLAVLKAGRAFLCLDGDHPRGRLREILQEAAPSCLITDSNSWAQHANLFPQDAGQRVVFSDLSPEEARNQGPGCASSRPFESCPDDNPATPIHPRDRAFICYTSGSTGSPKGIVQTHRNFSQFLAWYGRQFQLAPGKRMAHWASISYDASYAEILGALCFGATLCMTSGAIRRDPSALLKWGREERLTHLQLVPSFLQQLLAELEVRNRPSKSDIWPELEFLLLAGEVLHPLTVHRWRSLCPDRPRLFNLYGPTECVLATCYEVAEADLSRPSTPLGRAFEGRHVLVLDHSMEPCPPGVVGEIHIRSPYLSSGYLSRPEETQQVFLPDLLDSDPSIGIYRSGDLGRWLENGILEFRGRRDQQLKVRGVRIELEEVEAVLARHRDIRECAVVPRSSGQDGVSLAAYLVAEGSSKPAAGSSMDTRLRSCLRESLPEPAIPSWFRFLESLPRTRTGKIDRAALRRLDQQWSEEELEERRRSSQDPATPVEAQIADLWKDFLHVDQVGRHDDFFQLGGHSLLATQVVNRLRSVFSVDLPLRRFLEANTVAGLAACLEEIRRDAGEAAVPDLPLRARNETDPSPASFAQQRLWFLDQVQSGTSLYNIPAPLRLDGDLQVGALKRSLGEIVRRHQVLRTTFVEDNRRLLQVVQPFKPLDLPLIDLSGLPSATGRAEARRVAEADAERPFNIDQSPLLRSALIRLQESQHILLLNWHHIAFDGWSSGVFMEEMCRLYEAFSSGRPSPLAPLPLQYADFAAWQREWLQGDALRRQVEYWKKEVGERPSGLDLPTDRPRPRVQSYRGGKKLFRLSKDLSAGLRALSRQQSATLFMTLLAAFKVLLHRYASQDQILVCSPIANRNRVEIEKLIGYFVNNLILGGDLSENPSFQDFLQQVRQRTLDAYDHQDLPYEKLVEELQPERDLSRQPLAQVMFQLQNAPRAPRNPRGLRVGLMEVESVKTAFDLTLSMWESGGRLNGEFVYSSDLFEEETVEGWVRHYRRLLEGIVADPARPVSRLPLLEEKEREVL